MSVNIKIKITKDILEKSTICAEGGVSRNTNCAFAHAVRDILPEALVTKFTIIPFGYFKDSYLACISQIKNQSFSITPEMKEYIADFDSCYSKEDILALPEKEFELELPDWVVNRIGNGNVEEVKNIISQSKTLELCQ